MMRTSRNAPRNVMMIETRSLNPIVSSVRIVHTVHYVYISSIVWYLRILTGLHCNIVSPTILPNGHSACYVYIVMGHAHTNQCSPNMNDMDIPRYLSM